MPLRSLGFALPSTPEVFAEVFFAVAVPVGFVDVPRAVGGALAPALPGLVSRPGFTMPPPAGPERTTPGKHLRVGFARRARTRARACLLAERRRWPIFVRRARSRNS